MPEFKVDDSVLVSHGIGTLSGRIQELYGDRAVVVVDFGTVSVPLSDIQPAPATGGLPRDEDGEIITSASFGETHMVRIWCNTDFDGREIDPAKEDYAETFHGPCSSEEANEWMLAYPDDTNIHDMQVVALNKVKP